MKRSLAVTAVIQRRVADLP